MTGFRTGGWDRVIRVTMEMETRSRKKAFVAHNIFGGTKSWTDEMMRMNSV